MNYSHMLIIHYSFKNFLIVDGCDIIKGTLPGKTLIWNLKSFVSSIPLYFYRLYIMTIAKISKTAIFYITETLMNLFLRYCYIILFFDKNCHIWILTKKEPFFSKGTNYFTLPLPRRYGMILLEPGMSYKIDHYHRRSTFTVFFIVSYFLAITYSKNINKH